MKRTVNELMAPPDANTIQSETPKGLTFMVVSAEHDASRCPSGLKDTDCTTLVCPFSVRSHSPVS